MKGVVKMATFYFTNQVGGKGYVDIESVGKDSVIRLKINKIKSGNFIAENVNGTIAFAMSERYPYIQLKDFKKSIRISNQKFIDYIWVKNGGSIYSAIYTRTTDYANNWED